MSDISKSETGAMQSASRSGNGPQAAGSEARQASLPSGGIGEQATAAARDLKDRTANTAKELASEAGDKLRVAAEEKKAAGADRMRNIANTVRRVADVLEGELPQAGPYVRRAADELETVTDAVRQRDVRELVTNVQDFARRNPTLFISGSILAGIVLVRFLKSSSRGYEGTGGGEKERQNQGSGSATEGVGAFGHASGRSADELSPKY